MKRAMGTKRWVIGDNYRWGQVLFLVKKQNERLDPSSFSENVGCVPDIPGKLLILIAREYGYPVKEIAEYIRRDPAIISRALGDTEQLKGDVERGVIQLKGE